MRGTACQLSATKVVTWNSLTCVRMCVCWLLQPMTNHAAATQLNQGPAN